MKLYLISSLAAIFLLWSACGSQQEPGEIDLNGPWRFTLGDSAAYARIDFPDSTWSLIPFNKSLSQQGYVDYDGYAWYRYKVVIPSSLKAGKDVKKLEFIFGKIDDRDEFYLNDSLIGTSNDFSISRKYEVPITDRHLFWDRENVIALRVLDYGDDGGMMSANAYINPSNRDVTEKIPMDTTWKFFPGDSPVYAQTNYDDSKWPVIYSGKDWERQGFENFNGIAWYRQEIEIPSVLQEENSKTNGRIKLYLGKIDDNDQVFLNGSLIGENNVTAGIGAAVTDEFTRQPTLVNVERVYELAPQDKRVNWGGKNLIAIRVFDSALTGGMHNGNPYIRACNLLDDLKIDNSKLYKVNAASELDTTISIYNGTKEVFKGWVRYKGTVLNKSVAEKQIEIVVHPQDTAVVGVSLPYSTDEVVLTLSIDDLHSSNIYKEKTVLPFVLWK